MIFIGADHRGFELKESLKKRLVDEGLEVTDLGAEVLNPTDDYVDFAKKVATAVSENEKSFGVIICGSGVGVDMAANKFKGIRSSLVQDVIRAKQSREHEDSNVLSLASDILDEETALDIIHTFLNTPFSNEERHIRRLKKMAEIEEEQ